MGGDRAVITTSVGSNDRLNSQMIRAIAHPTDFSEQGEAAFACAMCLALANRCELALLHVHGFDERNAWQQFPRVRSILQKWGILDEGAPSTDVYSRTGVAVTKFEIRDSDPGGGLSHFLQDNRPDLIVMATRGHAGLNRWYRGSVTADLVRATLVPTLVLGPACTPFVDLETGAIDIGTVLVPVDHEPPASDAIALLEAITHNLDVELDLVHVGPQGPVLRDAGGAERPVRTVDGQPVETILAEARNRKLIAMPVAGRDGLLDALLGSTSERVVGKATCPILAIPVAS